MRRVYDATGLFHLEEDQIVYVRRGKFKGRRCRLTHIRHIAETSTVRVYVRALRSDDGVWLAPRSIEIIHEMEGAA